MTLAVSVLGVRLEVRIARAARFDVDVDVWDGDGYEARCGTCGEGEGYHAGRRKECPIQGRQDG